MLAVKLVGTTGNRSAIGAKVTVRVGDRALVRELHAGEGFAAQNSSILHFGLGDSERAGPVTVRWRDGRTTEATDAAAGSLLTFTEGATQVATEPWIRHNPGP